MEKAWCNLKISSGQQVKIDREDLEKINEHTWRVTFGTTGRLRVVTSIRGPNGPRSITLGRFLMKPAKNKQVYPRRFNEGLDYRKNNLIICSVKERQRLISKTKTNTSSSYKGVSYLKADKRWRAGIKVNGRAYNLGNFVKETAAALAYNIAARKFFGAIAYQNDITRQQKRKVSKKKK